ncbi:MAG: hypothetical protein KIT73_06220 [Burkholderiales bacterium]|nr:hypothetical protein [Burkholderiales bacterium]
MAWVWSAAVPILIATVPCAWADDDNVDRVLGSDHYVAGQVIRVDRPTPGDLVAAGGMIDVRAPVAGDVVAVGGSVELRAPVEDDVYAAGGSVRLESRVGESARLAGRSIVVTREAVVDGSLAAAGGSVRFEGQGGEAVSLAGPTLVFDGRAAGDVYLAGRDVTVGPSTVIDGKLTIRSARPAQIDPGARIGGEIVQEAVEVEEFRFQRVGDAAGRWFLGFWTVGVILAGVLLLVLAPHFLRRSAALVGVRPWPSLGLGFGLLVGVPVASVLAMVTLIGIPIGMLLLALYFPMLLAGYLNGALFVADRGLARLRPGADARRWPRILALVAVLIALSLLSGLPVVGGWIGFAVLLFGLGALALRLFGASPAPEPAP